MKHSIVIEKIKGHCSFQDLGRVSAQHLGFSVSGASDEYAFLSANYLLNNSKNSGALEIIFGQIQLKVNSNCTIILTGADCQATVISAESSIKTSTSIETSFETESKHINHWQIQQLKAGDCLLLKQPKKGLVTYLAVKGGFQAKQWLGSCSQNSNEMSLGFTENKLKQGSSLILSTNCYDENITHPAKNANNQNKDVTRWQHFYQHIHNNDILQLRFIPSALFLSLTTQQQQTFGDTVHTINADSNRMGYRLNSKLPLRLKETSTQLDSKLSKPVCFGTIQLPSNGQAIILMKDRQTIGGYPVLGHVMQTDLFRLSQKRPGEKIQFIITTIEHAQQQLSLFHKKWAS